MNISKEVVDLKDYIINLRRHFHQHPEPSLKEFNTAKKIKEELTKIGIPFVAVGETGVLGIISGKYPGKTILLRADIDALEITDKKDVEYKSKCDGLMHACGHDAHTASLLAAAKILFEKKDEIHGVIKLAFQQAEEVGGGARLFVGDNHLKDVDNVFGLHVMSLLEVGKIAVTDGPTSASCDIFKIEITGKSAHVSTPHKGIDALYCASSIVVELQSIAAREVDPLQPVVVGVGVLNSGTRYNIVANKATIEGTIRTFDHDVRKQVINALKRIVNDVTKSHNASASIDIFDAAPPLINESVSAKLAYDAAKDIVAEKNVVTNHPKSMGSDDFATLLLEAPGVYALIGTNNVNRKETQYNHHHELFDIDEDGLLISTQLYLNYTNRYLNEK